jgi:hypothetical protein
VSGVIHFGPRVVIGASFVSAGLWASPTIVWESHGIFLGGTLWGRTWVNRGLYVHPYEHPWIRPVGPRIERHEVHGREPKR